MILNNGHPININFPMLPLQEQQMYAQEFAEGSDDLKNILLLLWQNGINTNSCCAGHKYANKINDPYLSICVSTMTKAHIKRLLPLLFSLTCLKEIGLALYTIQNNSDSLPTLKEQNTIVIRCFYGKEIWKVLLDTFKKSFDCSTDFAAITKKLSAQQRHFINNVCLLKNIFINDVDLSYYKKHYKYLPDKPRRATMRYYTQDKTTYNITFKLQPLFNMYVDGKIYSSIAYTPKENNYYMIVDDKIKRVSKQKAIEYLIIEEYENLLNNLFNKNSLCFIKALTNNHKQ